MAINKDFIVSAGIQVATTANVVGSLGVGGNTTLTGNTTVTGSVTAANVTSTSNTVTIGTAAYHVSNGNFGIGTSTPGSKLEVAGATLLNGTVTLSTTSGLNANGTIGTAGQILSSNGTTAYWAAAGGTGTVTSVGSGNGLSGGPITGSGSLAVQANSGLIANSTGLFVNANTGVVANATGTFVNSAYIATISANNTTYLNGQLASYYLNATNLTGTLAYAQIPANITNTTSNFTITGLYTFSANVTFGAAAGIFANGTFGTAGQVLTANGSSIYWSNPLSGTVTNIATGNGLTGGPITTTGTASVQANSGLSANSTGVFVVANSGLISNTTGVFVNGNTGVVSNATGVFVNSAYIATVSANNASYLGGYAWSSPAVIGNGTANSATFTTITSSAGIQTLNNQYYKTANSTSGSARLLGMSTGNDINFGDVDNVGTGHIYFLSQGQIPLYVSGANVGIGQAVASQRLHLYGNSTTSLNNLRFYMEQGNGSVAMEVTQNDVNLDCSMSYYARNNGHHTFYTGSYTSIMEIASGGITARANVALAAGTAFAANNSYGTAGYVLTTSGTTAYWSPTVASAVKLTNPRNIGDVLFDGTNDIVPARVTWIDTRATNFNPLTYAGATLHFKSDTTDGLSDGGAAYHGVFNMQWYSDQSGGPSTTQLGLTHNNNLWIRTAASTTTWTSWDKLLKNSDWATPWVIGGTAANSATFTTITSTSSVNLNNNIFVYGANTVGGYGRLCGMFTDNNVYLGDIDNKGAGHVHIQAGGAAPLDITGSQIISNVPIAVTGAITATGNITAYYSDRRLKENIVPISNALDKVSQISGVNFNSNDVAAEYGYNDKSTQVGVIAQEIEQVLPQIVVRAPFDIGRNEDGTEYSLSGENYKTVQYERIVPLLIEAIKELKQELDDLKSKM